MTKNLKLAYELLCSLNKHTRNYEVLKYMFDNGSITSMQAISTFGNTRLAATIHELKKLGLEINREDIPMKNKPGAYAKYSIKCE